jgi:pyruvate kinase
MIVPAHTMATALAIARFRPQAPLVGLASSMQLYRSLALVRGVSPLLAIASGAGETGPQACVVQASEWLISHELAKPDDQIVLVFASGSACEQPDTLRTIRLSTKDECMG